MLISGPLGPTNFSNFSNFKSTKISTKIQTNQKNSYCFVKISKSLNRSVYKKWFMLIYKKQSLLKALPQISFSAKNVFAKKLTNFQISGSSLKKIPLSKKKISKFNFYNPNIFFIQFSKIKTIKVFPVLLKIYKIFESIPKLFSSMFLVDRC